MLMLRIMFMLSLATTNLFPAASIPLATDQRVIDFFAAVDATDIKTLDAIITANPYMVNATDVHGNTAMNKAQKAGNTKLIAYLIRKGARGPITIVKHKKTLEQHLAATPQVLTYTKGPITAFAFNPDDPWIKNLLLQEEFVYTPPAYPGTWHAGISTDGNRVLFRRIFHLATYEHETYELFERQKNGSWNKLTSYITNYSGNVGLSDKTSITTANGALNRIAVINKKDFHILDYNSHSNRWAETLKKIKINVPNIVSVTMNSAGNLVAVQTLEDIIFFHNHHKVWSRHSIPLRTHDPLRDGRIEMSGNGTYILATSQNKKELEIMRCPLTNEEVICEVLQVITTDANVSISRKAISDNGKYIAIITEEDLSEDKISRQCIVYQQKNDAWGKADTIDISNYEVYIHGITINDDGNCILIDANIDNLLLYKYTNTWKTIELFDHNMASMMATNPAINYMVIAKDDTFSILHILLPELLKLNANQLNFIRDLYEQDQMIKKSKNPHAWIILGPEDVKLFKTMSKDIQAALRRVYKITTQESLATAQQKLKEKREEREGLREFTFPTESSGPRRGETSADQKTAAQSVTTSTAVKK